MSKYSDYFFSYVSFVYSYTKLCLNRIMNTTYRFALFALVFFAGFAVTTHAQWKNVLKVPSYGLAWNPKNPKTMYVGGGARALYRTFDGGSTWDTVYIEFQGSGEEFLNVVVHPVDTSVVIIGGSRFGTIRRSSDCGKTWEIVLPPDISHTFIGESIIVDKSNTDNLFAADFNNSVIYKSVNKGVTWDSLSRIPRDSSGSITFQNSPCSITQRSDSTNIIFVGCLRSNIFRSDDFGKTWRRVAKLRSSKIDEPEVPQIHFSKSNPMVGYALTTYFFYVARPNGGIFITTDGGETWKESRFRDTAFWSIDSRPLPSGKGDEIVLGGFTEYFEADSIVPGSGNILRTLDNGTTWWNYKDRIPYEGGPDHSVITLRFVGNTYETQRLVAATIGGTCILEPDGLAGVPASFTAQDHHLQLRTVGDALHIEDRYPSASEPRICIVDILGRTLFSATMTAWNGSYTITIPVSVMQSGLCFAVVSRLDGSTSVARIHLQP